MINYLQVENLTKSYGDLVLFDNISFTIGEGQRIALIGRNGSGKTTLLNILAGKDTADSGTITPRRDLRIAYLEQNPEYAADLTVLEACFRSDNPALRAIAAYEQAVADPAQDGLQEAMSRMDALAAWDYEQRAKEILSRLKINDFDKKIGQLSGGQLKRVALAAVLISEADLLILDEPTNHLDTDMTEWLEEYLTRNKAALLMVTHDRYFLDRVCSDILEVDQRSVCLYKGNYAYYVEKKQERAEAAEARRESDLNLYRRELEWMRRQPQARATKARARIDSFHELDARLKSTRTQASLKLDVQATRIGTKIFEAKELCKRFGDLVILDRFNYNFARYDKLGIVGGQRLRQIDLPEAAHRHHTARQRHDRSGRKRPLRLLQPTRAGLRRGKEGDRHRNRHRPRNPPGRRTPDERIAIPAIFPLPARGAVQLCRKAQRRRAQAVIPLHDPDTESQFPDPRRAYERPGHRDARRTGRVPASIQGVRDRGFARPLLRR